MSLSSESPSFKSVCSSIAVWLWASYLPSLNPVCTVEIMIPNTQSCQRGWGHHPVSAPFPTCLDTENLKFQIMEKGILIPPIIIL